MTLIVGVRCRNGVVIGSDTTATYADSVGSHTIRYDGVRKLEVIQNKLIFALTGSSSMANRLIPVISEIASGQARLAPPNQGVSPVKIADVEPYQAVDWIRKVLHERVYAVEATAAGMAKRVGWENVANEAWSSFLLAVPGKSGDDGGGCLLCFNPVGLADEVKDPIFCACVGSGQGIADPFMGFLRRVLWNDQPPTVDQAIRGVTWCLEHAIALHPGGVGGDPQIAVMRRTGGKGWIAELVSEDELEQHRESIASIESKMRAWSLGKSTEEPPAPPAPTPG